MTLSPVWKQYGPPRFRTLDERTRWTTAIVLELLLAILLYFVDHALGYAVLTVAGIYWISRLPDLPWRLGAQVVMVLIFLVFGPRSVAAVLAIAFAIFWIPRRYRPWAIPVLVILL